MLRWEEGALFESVVELWCCLVLRLDWLLSSLGLKWKLGRCEKSCVLWKLACLIHGTHWKSPLTWNSSQPNTVTMRAVKTVLSLTMLSTFARSFTIQSNRLVVSRPSICTITSRLMSTPSGADTSIVEQCRSKIAAALETEDVKVTGKLHPSCFEFYLLNERWTWVLIWLIGFDVTEKSTPLSRVRAPKHHLK